MIGNVLDAPQQGPDVVAPDWFAQHLPSDVLNDGGVQTTMPQARSITAQQITDLYAKYGRQAPDDATIQAHLGNPNGIAGVEALLKADGGSQPASLPAVPTGGDAALRAQIAKWAAMPGADPSLASNPDYWVGAINARGGLTAANTQYWQDASVGPKAFFNNPNREQSGANPYAGLNPGGFGAAPAPYASNPNAPTAPGIPTPTGALASPYVAPQFAQPSVAEVEARPGYQIGLNTGLQQINRSAAAKGSVLNPGTVQALNRYGTDYAGTQYGNVLAQDLGIFQTNTSADLAGRQQNQTEFQQNVVQPTQTQFQNQYASYLNDNARTLSDYLTNYNIAHTADTDYWGRLKDVSGAGLTAALGDKAS